MSSVLGAVGTALGAVFGGPVGASIGGALGSALSGRQGERAEGQASQAQVQGFGRGIDEIRGFTEQGQAGFQPFLTGGTGAFEQQQALLGLLGPERGAEALASFQESPGQQFLRERGQRALTRNAGAIGGLGGGNVRSALVEQGTGFAQQNFGNFFNRLAGLSGQGLQAAGGLGQLGAQAGQSISGLLGSQGQARASGILGSQQARAGAQEQIGGFLSGIDFGSFGSPSTGDLVGDVLNTQGLF